MSDFEIILDTTVISNFSKTESMSELCESFDEPPAVTKAVIIETERGEREGYEFLDDAIDLMPSPRRSNTENTSYLIKCSSFSEMAHNNNNIDKGINHLLLSAEMNQVDIDTETGVDFVTECMSRLDWGEATAVHASFAHGVPVATDDGDARDFADKYDIEYTGSLGLLARCVSKDIVEIETANDWLSAWISENGYYSPVSDITEIL
ncbi:MULTISPECIES: hypothetical protein [Halorubrum]|uniref:Uncharacterized protein n=1 Tax=Halorubrum ruber TaxID=2982524 RepID=A0A8T8LN75_9EURY|nr:MULTISPECIES: hypothetical protein [Halorubrum]QUO48593.1 hypothetical protein J7656_04360 [Halorubrum ruber]